MTEATFRLDMLRSYQEEFLRTFTAEAGPGSRHMLIAPVAFGKAFAIAAAVGELMDRGDVRRVLLLAPSSVLVHQWRQLFDNWGRRAAVMDERAVRALRDRLEDRPEQLPPGLYLMTAALARRPDIAVFFAGGDWDLLILDEVAVDETDLGADLLSADPGPGLLLTTSWEHHRPALKRLRVIDWRPAASAMEEELSGRSSPLLTREVFRYRRAAEEVALIEKVASRAKGLGAEEGIKLLQAAASSVTALENELLSMASSDETERLLTLIADLRTESRIERFVTAVEDLAGGKRTADPTAREGGTTRSPHVVAFTEYRATSDLLYAAVADLDVPAYPLYEEMADEYLNLFYTRFRAEGGLLIVPGAAASGLPLDFVSTVIHYDLPLHPAAFVRREGRYRRYRMGRPCRVIFLEDESRSHPLENLLLERVLHLDPFAVDLDESEGAATTGLYAQVMEGIDRG